MRSWTPQTLYELKPAIVGAATLQMRQDYRANSQWRRDAPP